MWRLCIIYLLLFCSCRNVWAQNVIFTAQSVPKAGIQDQLQVIYTIQDAVNLQSMAPPESFKRDFQIVQGPYQSQQSSTSYINGRMTQSQSLTVTYIVQPRHTGNITVPGATARDAAGHTYQSNALTIQVVPGSIAAQYQQQQQQRGYDPFEDDPFEAMARRRQQQLQAIRQQMGQQQQAQAAPANVNLDKDLFIRVTVDKSKVRVGEQITASYKLYSRVPMQVNISKLPSLNGFWTQDFEMPKANIKPTEEIIDGKKYQVFVLKRSALFPQQTGNLELDPAEAEGIARIVQQVKQRNPFDDPALQNAFGSLMMNDPFFNDDFFNTMAYRDVKVHLKSAPVKITVTDLPEEGKPTDFTNAVGNFSLSSSIDKKELTTDDVANLKLTITGSGNLKLIEAPKLNLPNGLGSLDPAIVDTVTGRTTTISGTKYITYPLTPNTAGDFTIPAVSFSYFNSQTGKYVTLTTQPEKIHVKQGKGSKHDNRPLALSDIHPIDKKPLDKLTLNSKPLLFTAGYWSMYAFPLFAFMGLLVWKRRDEELSKDVVGMKRRRANKIALRRLVTAQKLLQENKQKAFYEEVSKAIWLYLSDKLNIPLSALSHEQANEAMTSRRVPYDLQQRAKLVVNECETALYAGYTGTQQMNQTYNDAISVITKLEEVFNS